jgi:hypothetical protein
MHGHWTNRWCGSRRIGKPTGRRAGVTPAATAKQLSLQQVNMIFFQMVAVSLRVLRRRIVRKTDSNLPSQLLESGQGSLRC